MENLDPKGVNFCVTDTLSHSCLKVHGGVPIALITFFGSSGAKDQLPSH